MNHSSLAALKLALLVVLAFIASPAPAATRPPNIVLIVADDLGYSDLGCYGARGFTTPNLDRMAAGGIRFTNFLVAQAVCTASRTALMSGCYPNRLGMAGALNHTSTNGLSPEEDLLPKLLKRRGYATAAFGKWHLGHQPKFMPTRQGFDVFAGIPYSNDNGPLHPSVRGIPSLPWYENETVTELDPDQSKFTSRLTERAVGFIKENRSRPFFLYLPHIMPHVPIAASAAFRGGSKSGLYGDTVQELDAGIGTVLATLREVGIERDTLVIFLSDNGPFLSYGDHAGSARPFREGKLTALEGGVRVPFIVSWPGKVPAGRTSGQFITGLDLLPSLVHLAGADLPRATTDGQDLSGVLLGTRGAAARDSFLYYSGRELHAVREGRWKLHLAHDYLTVNGPPGSGGKPANYANMKPDSIEESGVRGIASRHGYRVEKFAQSLFDLDKDPGETADLAGAHPDIVGRLMKLAAEARIDLGDSLTGALGANLRINGPMAGKR